MKKRNSFIEAVLGFLILGGIAYYASTRGDGDKASKANIEFLVANPYPVTAAANQVVNLKVANRDAEPRQFKANAMDLRGLKAEVTGAGGMQSPIALAAGETRDLTLSVDASTVQPGKVAVIGLSGLVEQPDGSWRPVVTGMIRLEVAPATAP